MSILDGVGRAFSSATRGRGGDYFLSGRVRVVQCGDGNLTARVSGSRRKPYVVEIDWAQRGLDEVVATCTCPHYEEGNLCKHVWATLLAMEEEGVGPTFSNPQAAILHEYDVEETVGERGGDEYECEYELEDENDYGYDDDDDEDGDDDWDDGPSGAVENEPIHVYRDHRGRLIVRDGRSEGKSRAGWKRRLAQISEYATTRAAAQRTASQDAGKHRQAWFALSVGECLATDRLVVHFRQRETRLTGELGKIKKLSVRSDDVPKFADEEDGRLVEILVGNPVSDDGCNGYGCGGYDDHRTVCRAVVLPATYETVLPRLCATGRFVWQMDDSLPVEEGTPITWDGGDPWRLRLGADDDPEHQRWRISGELVRGADRVPLADAVLAVRRPGAVSRSPGAAAYPP